MTPPSTPTTSTNLRDLFEAALALAPDERAAFLDAHCADATSRARIDAMLRADASDAEPVSSRAVDSLSRAIGESPAALPPGSRIGAFDIVRVIGEGGSSTVFEAHRELQGATQRVALKLLRQNLLSPEARRRFGREQRALIQLEHPHIAHIIEGGITPEGLAYIALELVEGMPITDYAAAHALDARERLRLFATVCRAVDAAHRALIVHRDLKPSNVLVTTEGEVKLLDFGIAKLLGDETGVDATVLPAFTPAYAAPEQVDGSAITTATDVYALGVVLGELLTGERIRGPNTLRAGSANAAHANATTTTTTTRRLRGDIDAVLTKATEPDPAQRYASAGEFAEEIRRVLEGHPVRARPQTRWYRTRRFVARHKGGVATTAAFLLAILAALGIAVWQADIARREAARARAENEFIAGLFDPLRTGVQQGEMPTTRQLLEAGVAQLNAQFAGDDAALADLEELFARVHVEIGVSDVARTLAERAYGHARIAWGERDPRTLAALARRGETAYHLGRFADAVSDLEQATAAMRAIGAHGDDYAFAMEDLGMTYNKVGRHAEAIAAQHVAYDLLKDSGDRVEIATAMNNLGGAYLAAGDAEQSLQWRKRAYDWHVAHGLGENRAALITLGNIARVEHGLGHWREALADLERLLPLRDKIAGGLLQRWSTTSQACSTAFWLWQLDKAEKYCEQALAEAEREASPTRPRAIVLGFRGSLRVRQGRYAQAREDLAESGRLLATIEGSNANYLYGNSIDMAEMIRVEGTPAQYAAALAPLLPTPEDEKKLAASSALLLARFALVCTETPSEESACHGDPAARARNLVNALPKGQPYRLPAMTALALRAVHLGDAPGAVAMLRPELAAASELGADHPWVGEAQAALAIAAAAAGDIALASTARHEAERIASLLPSGHPLRRRLLQTN